MQWRARHIVFILPICGIVCACLSPIACVSFRLIAVTMTRWYVSLLIQYKPLECRRSNISHKHSHVLAISKTSNQFELKIKYIKRVIGELRYRDTITDDNTCNSFFYFTYRPPFRTSSPSSAFLRCCRLFSWNTNARMSECMRSRIYRAANGETFSFCDSTQNI